MAATTGGAGELRAAAADLEAIVTARDAVTAAQEELDQIVRRVAFERRVTREQIAKALNTTRRNLYKRYPALGMTPAERERRLDQIETQLNEIALAHRYPNGIPQDDPQWATLVRERDLLTLGPGGNVGGL